LGGGRFVAPTARTLPVPGWDEHWSVVHGRRSVAHRSHAGLTKPAALILYLLVLIVFGGGGVAYASFDKTVHLTVDGQPRTVHTFARTVGAALGRAHIALGEHDVVQPKSSAHITNGARIAVDRGRPLNLVIDGRPAVLWVTGRTVAQVLDQLGLSDDGAFVSASTSAAVPITGLGLVVRMPHAVTILHDGTATRLFTNVSTVREAIAAARVRLGAHDRVSAPLGAMPTDNQVVTITRVSTSHVTVTLPIAFKTERIADASMYKGTTHVVHAGRVGIRVQRYDYVHVNGHVSKRLLASDRVIRTPITRVVHYGTKPKPTYGTYVGGGVDELDWYALAGCESNHDPRAYTARGPYYGLYQFSMGTWESVGGSGDPRDASTNEQTYRAKLLYKQAGDSSPWPTCGHYLYDN
jgi:uncharacterized protein YabE (DUF348 family)